MPSFQRLAAASLFLCETFFMTEPLRIVFAGTPEFAAEHLKALLDSPYEIIAVYTQPDRPAGRGQS